MYPGETLPARCLSPFSTAASRWSVRKRGQAPSPQAVFAGSGVDRATEPVPFSGLALKSNLSAHGSTPMLETDDLNLADYIRNIPDFPKPGILFRDITPLLLEPGGVSPGGRRAGQPVSRREDRRGGGRRGPRLHLRRAPGPGTAAPAWCRSASRASSRSRRSPAPTTWNTAPTRWKSTPTPSSRAPASWWSTTCWPPAARSRPAAAWSRRWAAIVVGCAFVIELAELGGRQRIAQYKTVSLVKYD